MGRPPASITIETDDIRKTFEELKSRGVEFASDVLEFPWGYVAQFEDPDGNRLQIREGREAPDRRTAGRLGRALGRRFERRPRGARRRAPRGSRGQSSSLPQRNLAAPAAISMPPSTCESNCGSSQYTPLWPSAV